MIVAPETEIYLLKTPLQLDELQQMDFVSATAQATYFQSCPKLALMGCTYQRENNTMWVKFNIEAIRNYNYVMYKNKQYSDKWFYAFITGMDYENNVVTGVHLKTDVFQTYMFEYELKQSYVLRETVDDDTYGKHLVSESFDLGEYVLKETEMISLADNTSSATTSSPLIVVQCSERIGQCYNNRQWQTIYDDMYITSGLPQGCWYYLFRNNNAGIAQTRLLKQYLDFIGKGNAILNMFLIPQGVVTTKSAVLRFFDVEGHLTDDGVGCYIVDDNTWGSKLVTIKTIARPTNFGKLNNTFVPRNNKTLTYPYTYMLATNNAGNAIDFHYENFTGSPDFYVYGTLSATTSYILMPLNSKISDIPQNGMSTEVLQGMTLPTLSWDSDYYLNWLAQNKGSREIEQNYLGSKMLLDAFQSFASPFISMGLGVDDKHPFNTAMASTMGGTNALFSVANDWLSISNATARWEEQNKVANAIPNTVKGNTGAGDIAFSFASTDVGFKFYKYEVKIEIAKKVDKYFDMFGYRVNEIKTPNTKTRKYWNYLETEKVNLEGNIPQEALQELKQIYNSGITIWHDPEHFLDYTLTNSIL